MSNISYTPLEGKNLEAIGVDAPSFNGDTGSFATTSGFVYTLFFTAIVIAASYRYVTAGTLRLQASESSIRASNQIIKQVTLGLLGVFSLFLILFTVNKGMLTGDIGLDYLRSGEAIIDGVIPITAGVIPTTNPNSSTTPPGQPGTASAGIQADPTVRAQLGSIGISVNKAVCSTPESTGCTTVGGLHPETLTMLSTLRNTCSQGQMVITGGTEKGHVSHGVGKTPVDLRIGDSALDSCIRSFPSGPVGPPFTYCNKTFVKFGYVFCDEKGGDSHWHIVK